MPYSAPQLPNEIYHRLYWYAKRNMAPLRIAAALNLPLKTVNNFIGRFRTDHAIADPTVPDAATNTQTDSADLTDFLDIFIFSKTRHSVIDISGSLDKKNSGKLTELLLRTKTSHRNPLALKMTDILYIDESGAKTILDLFEEFKLLGRYFAILDPSAAIEPALKQYGVDGMVPIFGTEIAFEEHAFR
jgi:anti-anti-sigma factor